MRKIMKLEVLLHLLVAVMAIAILAISLGQPAVKAQTGVCYADNERCWLASQCRPLDKFRQASQRMF
jgi:hypothetical protein